MAKTIDLSKLTNREARKLLDALRKLASEKPGDPDDYWGGYYAYYDKDPRGDKK